jgi:MerR family transcriptional regulator, light-induced transcriptional regulator
VDKGGHTVTATRFAELTGVSRERLRTWERRYGFPRPHRVARGPRRYALSDVPNVVAVRRAAETGVPLQIAIRAARAAGDTAELSPSTFQGMVEQAPLAALVLSGPVPLRVEYVNAALAATRGAPRVGDDLVAAIPAFAGSECVALLERLFRSDTESAECEHPAWGAREGSGGRSALFRLPAAPGAPQLVAMIGLEGGDARSARAALDEVRRELEEARRHEGLQDGWLSALGALAREFRTEPGPEVVGSALDVLIRQLGAVDGALATYLTGQLALPNSRRGLLRARMLTVAAHPQLGRGLRDEVALWLDRAAAGGLGVPADLHAAGIPVLVAGETLGLLVLLFERAEPIAGDQERLLSVVSAAVGFALLRDRLAAELRDAAV